LPADGGSLRLRVTGVVPQVPLPSPSTVAKPGKKERALFEASHDGIEDPVMAPSCARRPVWRGTQGIGASRRGLRVPFSLGTFSWASKRKYLAVKAKPPPNPPQKRKTDHQNGNPDRETIRLAVHYRD